MAEMVLIVTMAGEKVAVRTTLITTVIQLATVCPVPRAPEHVAGITALRSRGMLVIDCRVSLGENEVAECSVDNHAVVIEMEGHAYALAVDGVHDVSEIISGPAPVQVSLPGNWKNASEGMVELPTGSAMLVDPFRLIAGPVQEVDAA
ncbi:chemotaxis protein CheW [Alteraurantiacibacter aquimixticola]|uniref:Chemotaxis protein CheW n=1 Tax=Alteraurantiacibacter aquimixticola TaxID=2489173 RepID=A0A4T3F4H0_9SPHN|nr:chemotaxis protein CheW [Alteraurantiacibacter aquimixticola]TIX49603.1 chemotaxis protein CheW [Alteraurantiacibacter aquimixticola]